MSKKIFKLYVRKKVLVKLNHFSYHLFLFIFHFFHLREAERREKRDEIRKKYGWYQLNDIKLILLHDFY